MSTAPIPNFGLATFYKETPSFAYSVLLSDGDDVVSRLGTTTLNLTRGTIGMYNPATGVVTASGGPYNCIVAENCNGTSGAVACLVYVSGKFKADALVWPGGQSHAITSDQLRDAAILVESVVFTDGTVVKSAPSAEDEAEAKKRIEVNRKLQAGPAKDDKEKPDLTGGVTDSSWGYLTEEERKDHPELSDPIPLAASDAEKEAVVKPTAEKQPPKPPVHGPGHEGGKR